MYNSKASDPDIILHVINLTKKFGDFTAVNNINFEIRRGEVFGLLGHNGAGKTTIINLLVGLIQPTSGRAFICGHNVVEEPLKARRKIGLLPDNSGNYLHLTAWQNLEFFAELADVPKGIRDKRITDLLETVGLSDWRDIKVEIFSRGMKQRLGLAQCLIRDPEVLFFDEPTLGIDPEGVRTIRDLVHRLSKEEGKAILICSHLLHEVSRVCDRVAVMRWGRIVAMGTIEELRSQLGLADQIDLEEIFIQIHGKEDA
jgi:ABC-2 type transport system ATP-binding protein